MSMITQCPSCATTFRVTPQDLQSHSGQVRCGRCTHVFDAYAHLATLPDEGENGNKTDELEAPKTLAEAIEPSDVLVNSLPSSEPDSELAMQNIAAADFVTDFFSAPAKRIRWPWAIGILFTLLITLAQALFWFRVDIAAHYSALKAPLVRLCNIVGCTVDLPSTAEALDIEASDLQPENPAKPKLLIFTTNVRNRSSLNQAFPAIELTLTSAQNNVVARRVFMPKDYISPEQSITAGIAPKSDFSVRLNLDIRDLDAAGYRVYFFYP